jgi:anti-repressor protein
MTVILPFNFEERPVRIEDRDGQPWFVAADICAALDIANHRDALSRLDEDERASVVVDTPGGAQSVAAVSESGMYSLVMRSRKAAAKRFRRWVTGEVLPTIRRSGMYGASAPAIDLNDPETLQRALLAMTSRTISAEARVTQAEEATEAVRTKADALDLLANSAGTLNLTDAAKALGVQPRRLVNQLIAREWIFRRRDGRLSAMQAHLNSGNLTQKVYRRFRTDGTTAIEHQPLVTATGLAKLAKALGRPVT